MAVPLKPKSVALDTCVMIDLASGDAVSDTALKAIRRRLTGTVIIVTPTAVQELAWLATEADEEETRNLATLALRDLKARWGIEPANCNPANHGIIELAAQELRARGVVPEEEVGDSLIIAESSSAECALLVSADGHMLDADNNNLNQILVGRHLNPIVIISPWKIAKDYAPA